MIEINIEKPDSNTVAVTIKSDEVYKNTTLLLTPEEAGKLASEIMSSALGQIFCSD